MFEPGHIVDQALRCCGDNTAAISRIGLGGV